jgi:hypothetical protein
MKVLPYFVFSEFFMKPKEWHKIRGVIMIATMKASSVAVDRAEISSPINFFEYVGYMLCSVTVLFGPWTSFESYINLYKKTTWVDNSNISLYLIIKKFKSML